MSKKSSFTDFASLMANLHPEYTPEKTPELPKEKEEFFKPNQQEVRIWLEKNHRGGKKATVIKGLEESDAGIEKHAKALKTLCGVGGSAKDGEIILQGDVRDKCLKYFLDKNYKAKKGA
jgi:translation initiation factor 1